MHDSSILSRIAHQLTLRRAERLAHVASAVAVILTLAVVGAAQAEEANPAAAWFIAHGGLRAWSLATPLLVASLFAIFRWTAERDATSTRVAAWFAASMLAADAIGNAIVTTLTGWPNVYWAWFTPGAAAVAVLAFGLALRWELRRLFAPVAGKLSSAKGSKAAAALASLLVVTSGLGGIALVNPNFSSVQNATAATSEWSYTGSSWDISTNIGDVHDIAKGPNGNWFVLDDSSDSVYKYDSTWTYTGTSYDVGTEDTIPYSIHYGDDGNWYMSGVSNDKIYVYDSTWTYTGTSHDTSTESLDPMGIHQTDSGKWYMLSNYGGVYRYSSNWGYSGTSWNVSTEVSSPGDLQQQDNGKWYVVNRSGTVEKYDSSFIHQTSFDVSSETTAPQGLSRVSGNWYLASTTTPDSIFEYTAAELASKVNGTVTDADGDPISGATVSDGAGNSTTTDANGDWNMSLKDDTYTLTASKSGYLSESQSVTVNGSTVTGVNFSLAERSIAGTVAACPVTDPRCSNPAPVEGATVQVAAINYSHPDISGATTQETQQNAEDYLQGLIPDPPTQFTGQQSSDFALTGSTGYLGKQDARVGLLHSPDDLDTAQLSIIPDNADLSNPLWQGITPQRQMLVSCWDPTTQGGIAGSGIGENEYDGQLPGTHQKDCTVEITQLAGVDGIGTTRVAMNQSYSSGGWDPSKLHYGTVSLPAGWYRVQAENSNASYVVQVGDPTQAMLSELKNQAGSYTTPAKQWQDGISQNVFETKTVTTGPNGKFSAQINDTDLKFVGVQAYKYPGGSVDPANLTLDTMRTDANSDALNGSVYVPSRVYTSKMPRGGLDVRMHEVSWAPFGNATAFQDQFQQFLNALLNGSWSDLPPALQQRLDSLTDQDLQSAFEKMDSLRKQNDRLQQQYREALERRSGGGSVTVDINPDDASRSELKRRVAALQESMTQLQGDINSGTPTAETGSETVSLSFPFDTNLQPNNVLLRVHYNNGTTRTLNTSSDYVSIDQRFGRGDVVKVTDYPLGQGDAAVADFEVDVATADGTGSASKAVTNPTFSGEIPSLNAVEFSSLRPGPSETVSVDLHPEDHARFDALTGATVFGPQGSQLSRSNITDDEFSFTTAGSGPHRVELTFTNPGGVQFTEVVYLSAGSTSQEWPASIRTKSGPTGVYALVGDGLDSGRVNVKEGGSKVDIAAIIPQSADAPSSLHVYTQGLETAPDSTTQVSVLRGDSEEAVKKHVPVTAHGPTIGENALVYRDGEPLPRGDGNQYGRVEVQGNQTVIETITTDTGTVSLRVSADPGYIERARYWVATRVPSIDLPGLVVFPSLPGAPTSGPAIGGLALLGAAATLRRRYP